MGNNLGKDRPYGRQSIRLSEYDYSQPSVYFVTICTQRRKYLFGDVLDGMMAINKYGFIVHECWHGIPKHFRNVELDAFVIMPNHLHGILFLADRRGTACRAPTKEKFGKPVATSLPTIIRSFKSAATKCLRDFSGEQKTLFWQRNYFEHVIRNEESLLKIREYIITNPQRWQFDSENLLCQSRDKFDLWLSSFPKPSNKNVDPRKTTSCAKN